MNNVILKITILFLLLGNLSACYEPKTGCLDINATNFDVEADEECCINVDDCCCNYPQLSLSIDHKLYSDSTDNFNLQTGYTLEANPDQVFQVNDIKFYLTNFQLVNSSTGAIANITDTIILQIVDLQTGDLNDAVAIDNFSLIKRNGFNYQIGALDNSGDFDEIHFNIGIESPFNNTFPDDLNVTHPLSNAIDSMYNYDSFSYVFNQINLQRDTASVSSEILIEITELIPIQLALTEPISIALGTDTEIKLRINYLNWFKGINFAVNTENEIKQSIVQNTANVFEYFE